jgi:hypothetical protein
MAKIEDMALKTKQREELEANLRDLTITNTEIAGKLTSWGHPIHRSSIAQFRANLGLVRTPESREPEDDREQASVTVGRDGGTLSTGAMDRPLDLSTDWSEVLRGFGLDPEIFVVKNDTVRMSKWQQSRRLDSGDRDIVRLYSYRAEFVRRMPDLEEVDVAALRKRIAAWHPSKPKRKSDDTQPSTFVVCWADWQLGKSAGGGVAATVDRIHESFQMTVDRIAELRKRRNIERVVVINMGDPIEGCDGNYSSQLASVELNQREQLNTALDLWAAGIMAIQPDEFASAMCNHGEWTRRGPGTKPVTTDSDNVGGYLADTLRRVFEGREGAPTKWSIPHDEMVTILSLSGLDVAITHGHKIPSASKEVEWLKGQSIRLLREQGAEPRLWITAHKHHVDIRDFGAWWRMQCPSLDGGSKWYTDSSGNWSTPGTMTFLAGRHDPRGWSDLAILGSGV